MRDPSKSLAPDPTAIPSAEEFKRNNNFGIVTAWCAFGALLLQ